MQVNNYRITWLHPSHFKRACEINRESGFHKRNVGWLNRLYNCHENVFSQAVFSDKGIMLGWSAYSKTTSGIELLWMIVPDEHCHNGIGTAMIDRMKVWLEAVPNRRGALTCSVHEYSDDMLYFLRGRGFQCLKINPDAQSYRMVYIRELTD